MCIRDSPQEGLCGIHLQLMSPHDVKDHLQVRYVITFSAAFYRDVINIAFHRFAYLLMENGIHS